MARSLSTSSKLKLAYVALAATDTWLSGSHRPIAHKARVVTKPLLMPTLAASLLTSPKARTSPLLASTLAAQALGWGGDVALLGDGTASFARGAGSFGVGHLAYISGFARHRNPVGSLTTSVVPRAVAATWAVSTPAVAVGAYRKDPRLGAAMVGYSALLASMVATSSRLGPSVPAAARRTTLAGAALFMTSDAILGLRKFVLPDPPPRLESAVMASYTAAQFLLSEGAARAGH